MANLSPQKRFPGSTGVEVPARVTVSTPIPRREVPLPGTKSMRFPPGRIDEILPMSTSPEAESKTQEKDFAKFAKDILFWPVVIPLTVMLYFYLSIILFCLLT